MATVASSFVNGRTKITYPGSHDCHQGCDFVTGGWPFPFLIDHPAISPTGSVSLTAGLLGDDIFRVPSFAATLIFWLATVLLIRLIAKSLQKTK
jgi:hypothetical protein